MLPAEAHALAMRTALFKMRHQISHVHVSALVQETLMILEQAHGISEYSVSRFICTPCPTTDI